MPQARLRAWGRYPRGRKKKLLFLRELPQNKAQIQYTDAKVKVSSRVVWPMLIGVFENYYVLVAWCETRSAYRNFRLDRINQWTTLKEKYPKSRNSLLKEWQSMEGITNKVIRY